MYPSLDCRTTIVTLLFLLVGNMGLAQPAPMPEDNALPFANARELLAATGVDESHFRMFMDGQPADAGEQEPLLRMLFAIRRSPTPEIERFARDKFALPDGADASDLLRGEIFRLRGTVTRIDVETPLPEVIDRYEMKRYFRCWIQIEPAKLPATVFALEVPKSWPVGEAISERVSLLGFYLKMAPHDKDESLQPVFATQRVAWHPEGLLGDLGMDAGLFDAVENKSSIRAEERECFYQLLAAAGRANPKELFQLTERPAEDDYSVVPLFNDPDNQHGQLVALTGTARRALLVKLDPVQDAEAIAQLGADHYYQVEIFTHDSQGNPLVFCVRELPEGMPQGPEIYEAVRIPGFFFKTWAYRLQPREGQPEGGHQLAPMLVGNQLLWLQVDRGRNPWVGALAGGFFVLALLGAWFGVWAYNRSDRKFHERVMARQFQPEPGKSLNNLDIEARNGPDFDHLK